MTSAADLPKKLEISPVPGPLAASIRPPGSKSITNRALVLAALAKGTSTLLGALDSEDTRVMLTALKNLGFEISVSENKQQLTVTGAGGVIPATEAELFVENSGTSIRFLTALTTLGHGSFKLDGISRMQERPISDLLDGLNLLGADCRTLLENNCPPVQVHANGLPGGVAEIAGNISSQYLSAILMAAPCAQKPVTLNIVGRLVSQPYIRMTTEVMRAFGVETKTNSTLSEFEISAPASYQATTYTIEPDASAASYFWAAAAILGGSVRVEGLNRQSLQGDVAMVEALAQMGCEVTYSADSITVTCHQPLRGIRVDMNAISDTMQTLAVVALFANGPTTITNIAHVRHKETDRIAAMATELRKLGATVEETESSITIIPPIPTKLQAAELDTYNDHRMAMALALAGLKIPGVVIKNPSCTVKTYPNFFSDLSAVTSPS